MIYVFSEGFSFNVDSTQLFYTFHTPNKTGLFYRLAD